MKILAVIQGAYGERIVINIKKHCPPGWAIELITLSKDLPVLIDTPEEFLPAKLPESDLILFLAESANASQLIPDIARMAGAAGVVAPIDHSAWLPQGLKNQIRHELDRLGIDSVYPKNFCTLTTNSCGYRDSAEPYESEIIAEFAKHFGRPKLKVDVDPTTKAIRAITVERGSACGSTLHAVNKIIGMQVDQAVPKAGLLAMQFPCLASMQMEHIDKGLYNTLMHLSGQIFNEELEPHIEPFYSAEKKEC
ncbi:MAG: hypothetical protein GY868_07260 [Deltaproteobacteria bacterium]|nr:hypothetical protein [Deltaproteobacteria bacterium]